MWPNPQFLAALVTFTEEIRNGKLHFCAVGLPEKDHKVFISVRVILEVYSKNINSKKVIVIKKGRN